MAAIQNPLANAVEHLKSEIKKLKMENKILQAKNMILRQNCEEYTSRNEQQLAAHQLELNLAKVPMKNLQIKIKTLQKVNDKLNKQRDKYRKRIAEYEQKYIEYERTINKNKELYHQLKKCKDKIEILEMQNMRMKDELYDGHIAITSKEQRIAELREQLREIHNRFERKLRRNASRSTNTLKIEMSQSIKTTLLSQSSTTLCYSSDSAQPQFYCNSVSISSASKYKRLKKRNRKRKKKNISSSNILYDIDDDKIYSENIEEDSATRAFWEYDTAEHTVDLYETYDSNADHLELKELDSYPLFVEHIEDIDAVSLSLSRRSSTQYTPNYGYCN